jgi:diaminopimelate epimerase
MGTDSIRFVKAEANGNDFVIVDAAFVAPEARPGFARRICDRHRGVGADGVEFVAAHDAHIDLDLVNADGSLAEVSGNGTRCVAAFYARHGFRKGKLHTGGGVLEAKVVNDGPDWEIEIGFPPPRLEGEVKLRALDREWPVFALSMGNPQCVLRVDEFAPDWLALGAALEAHPHFPHRANVELVRVAGPGAIEIRIFERGVGPTASSGTGSSAAAVAAMAQGWVASPVIVRSPGGVQRVAWRGAGTEVYLTGPARIVAEGLFLP